LLGHKRRELLDHRLDRFEEALQPITGLLRDGRIDFAGTHCRARDGKLRPRRPRPTGPTIMIGTARPRMLRLATQNTPISGTS
jgi:alkanesulfonate monooxygenase SsuD/methylene tetrahydromethanopterin reductase-like flavin-dependent oxidoreductase (luciferase family)